MSEYTRRIVQLEESYNNSEEIKRKVEEFKIRLRDLNEQYGIMLEAQQLLTAVSEDNTKAVLDYITGIINRALAKMFPYDKRSIYIDKTMYRGQHAHMNIILCNAEGKKRDLQLQSGAGIRQTISFLFVLSMIEITKGRRILLMDELLNGLHEEAKVVILDIIKIFASQGFQFVMVEYGVNDLGKIYLIEKPGKTASATPLGRGEYKNEVFVFNKPDGISDVDIGGGSTPNLN